MCRSKSKGPFIKKVVFLKKNKIIINRNIQVVPKFVGFNFSVYNGKNFINITVQEKMVGHKFGTFCFTKFKHGTKN